MLNPYIFKNSRSALKKPEVKNSGCAIFSEGLRDTVGQNVISLKLVEILSITITWVVTVLMKIQHYLLDGPENSIYMYISAEDAVHWSASAEIVNIAVQMHKLNFIICIFSPSWQTINSVWWVMPLYGYSGCTVGGSEWDADFIWISALLSTGLQFWHCLPLLQSSFLFQHLFMDRSLLLLLSWYIHCCFTTIYVCVLFLIAFCNSYALSSHVSCTRHTYL